MKRTIKITAKSPGETAVTITAQVQFNGLTTGEANAKKERLQDSLHGVLMNHGFRASEIKIR